MLQYFRLFTIDMRALQTKQGVFENKVFLKFEDKTMVLKNTMIFF
jgi:hypothetical protein